MKIKKQRFYILNTITNKNYDLIEDRFYDNNFEPQCTNDKLCLLNLIYSNRVKFKDCIVETS
jgi:hypothetical protein